MNERIAFVTGGASGIGRATAHAFVDAGVALAIVDRDARALEQTARDLSALGADVMPILADISEVDRLDELFQSAFARFGRIDYLVNSAARVGGTYDFLTVQSSEWDKTFQVNLTAPLLLMQSFARHAIERGGGGRIVNVTSSSAFRAQGARPGYGSSKAALGALTRIVAAQLGEHDVNVNAVAPGITQTPGAVRAMNGDADGVNAKAAAGPNANFFRRVTQPQDVAATILFLCSPGARQITGQTIHVSAGTITP